MNTAECAAGAVRPRAERCTSMEPPCEHGGVRRLERDVPRLVRTSMEPPCEHGGVLESEAAESKPAALQWSRRVNTAECSSKQAQGLGAPGYFNGAAV